METQQQNPDEQDQNPAPETNKKGGIHNNALYAASLGRAATAQVSHHSSRGLAQTGTNVSYEGATAPGGGVGSGYSSGQSAAESRISSPSDYDRAAVGKKHGKHEDDGHSQKDGAADLNKEEEPLK